MKFVFILPCWHVHVVFFGLIGHGELQFYCLIQYIRNDLYNKSFLIYFFNCHIKFYVFLFTAASVITHALTESVQEEKLELKRGSMPIHLFC